jgi:(4S)-4-hydroxy-5-phosphonooxypentane-2,3-dione isomerase
MFVAVAIYKIHPEHIEAFQRRVRIHAATCLRVEKGCLAFEINRSVDDPSVFLMHEVYRSSDDFAAHGRTPHLAEFLADRDRGGWLAERIIYRLDRVELEEASG